jgi:hypothetical protein
MFCFLVRNRPILKTHTFKKYDKYFYNENMFVHYICSRCNFTLWTNIKIRTVFSDVKNAKLTCDEITIKNILE